jgi:imidazolonepropionase-like amidohydrolase
MGIFRECLSGKSFFLLLFFLILSQLATPQSTFPVNGVADPRIKCYAFTNAFIMKDSQTLLDSAILVIREGKIVAIGKNIIIPNDAVTVDCRGKYICSSFIDIYGDYGVSIASRQSVTDPNNFIHANSNTKGAYGWNQAIRPEVDASKIFVADDAKAKLMRDNGFGTVLTHQKDGIARGTGVLVTLANDKENLVIIKEKASAHYSINKGNSLQSYPTSLMGAIALLRQTYLDAKWYKNKPEHEGVNLSLQAWLDNQNLPQIFEADDKWNDLRADRIGNEEGVKYIIKGGGNEYQRIKEIAGTRASFILPLNFPVAIDVEDPDDARLVSLAEMKHWELAPSNPAAFEKAHIPFCLTMADLKDSKQFMSNLRKAFDNGLTERAAFDALTKTPATLLGVYDKVGSLEPGKLANFLITDGPLFREKTAVLQNWIQGIKYVLKENGWNDVKGIYNLVIHLPDGQVSYRLDVKNSGEANVIGKDTLPVKFAFDGKLIKLNFSPMKAANAAFYRLSGTAYRDSWNGSGEDTSGNPIWWTANFSKPILVPPDTTGKKIPPIPGKVYYPFNGYGWEELPQAANLLIKNATVWTNEKEGKLENTDVLVKNGKIAQIGKNLSEVSATVIDGTGKHLTPGIVDEHSHIAVVSINEWAQSVTSEVRIGDNLNPEDIDIYRQLSGGVTSSHILHGSANTIGGQTQLIKLRWGANDEDLKFRNWDPFIKFALGENVKVTYSSQNNRFPDTRMGVEAVLVDAFQRARDYQNTMKKIGPFRKDLELDALVEILEKKRFITCHSYVQSEVISMMRVAEKFGFKVNTFTHILEGYKVADKMKLQGANASTFSDWWAYKVEVQDAIPYNASIMHRMGLNVCINSDDPEMARRLNQEAAKSVKYGGMSEEDALKMVTLNPAKALHVDDRVGSIRAGKDADLVLWSDHPLSIYAKSLKTIVDGIVYYDANRDLILRKRIASERNRLIQKMLSEKKLGMPVQPPRPNVRKLLDCGDHSDGEGLLRANMKDGGLE